MLTYSREKILTVRMPLYLEIAQDISNSLASYKLFSELIKMDKVD